MGNKIQKRKGLEFDIPRSDEEVVKANGFAEAVAMALAAMARNDAFITDQEYEALAYATDYLAEFSQHPTLFRVLTLHGLLSTTPFERAINEVKKYAKDQKEEARLAIITGIVPLLTCQGFEARTFAKAWASALQIKPDILDKVLSELPPADATGFMNKITSIWKPNASFIKAVRQFASTYRDEKLIEAVQLAEKDWPSNKSKKMLAKELLDATQRVLTRVESSIPSMKELEPQEKAANKFWYITDTLVEQLEQRLYFISERFQLQRSLFEQDLLNFVDTAVDLVELGMRDLVESHTYSWANKTLWEKFSKTDAANRILVKFQPLDNRYKTMFDLWKRELEEFSKELRHMAKAVFDNVDPAAFSKLVKTDHQFIDMKNQIDKVSDYTIGATTVTLVGGVILIATGVLPAAAILGAAGFIVSNPIGWAIGGAIGVSLLWKTISDSPGRKAKFIQDQREGLKESLIKLLDDPEKKHDQLCTEIERQFYDTASKYFAPLVRDARLTVMQPRLEAQAIRRILDDTRTACQKILSLKAND